MCVCVCVCEYGIFNFSDTDDGNRNRLRNVDNLFHLVHRFPARTALDSVAIRTESSASVKYFG
jgi:hypothetical protein